ncbi:hypothetical protein [Dethiosulfatarculus sandiegensis]|uniref:Uncharacterized protein n=1 Tax=Dethiosulfatarculus sandiegensis TaxID=1429043 RepID=A0A0D2JBX5_9BACT|nr:hypothetical protein [Dethiosulfatarculus sandiegensis]KIX13281.1 hypothetical protein X474_14975 [Dethiosulfatarculus sandiegensis]
MLFAKRKYFSKRFHSEFGLVLNRNKRIVPEVLLTVALAFLTAFAAPARADKFTPFVEVDLGYTDNARFQEVARESGFLRVSPGARLELGPPENHFRASGKINYDYYFDISEYTRVEGGSLDLHYTRVFSPKWILDISNTLVSTYDAPILDEDRLVTLEPVEGRRDRNSSTVRLTHNFGPDDTIFAEYTYLINHFEDEDADSSNIHWPRLGGKWRMSPNWRLEGEGGAKRTEYDLTPTIDSVSASLTLVRLMGPTQEASVTFAYSQARALTDDQEISDNRDYRIYSVILGYSHDLTQTFSYGAAAGVSKTFRADTPTTRGEQDIYPIVNLWAKWRGDTWRFGLSAETSLGEYDLYGQNAGLTFTHRVNADFTYRFTEHWNLYTRASYIRDSYKQEPLLAASFGRGDVHTYAFYSRLSWTMTRYLTLGLDYRLLYRDQEDPDEERRENRVMLILTGEYPYRW